MKASAIHLTLLLVILMSGNYANAQGALGNPGPGSDQSGIGLVSGYYCDADRIDVSFDGGALIEAAYGTTRADTIGVCGDDDNGFGLLWNYNLLGPGAHQVNVYADGSLFGTSSFTVTTLGREFLPGASQEVRVLGFPELASDIILKWQQGNQNYVISDYLPSMDSYNVSGSWQWIENNELVALVSILTTQSLVDPTVAQVGGSFVTIDAEGLAIFGAMAQNRAVVETNSPPGSGLGDILVELIFTGPRTGVATILDCIPPACDFLPIGYQASIVKFFPPAENASLPQSLESSGDSPDETMETAAAEIQRRMTELLYELEEIDEQGELEDQPIRQLKK